MNTLLLILECGILLNSATTIGATDENPLQHRTESLTIALQGSVAAVTPLFGPVQEVEWAPGWKPQFIHPTKGAQRDGVVFGTIGTNGKERLSGRLLLTTRRQAAWITCSLRRAADQQRVHWGNAINAALTKGGAHD